MAKPVRETKTSRLRLEETRDKLDHERQTLLAQVKEKHAISPSQKTKLVNITKQILRIDALCKRQDEHYARLYRIQKTQQQLNRKLAHIEHSYDRFRGLSHAKSTALIHRKLSTKAADKPATPKSTFTTEEQLNKLKFPEVPQTEPESNGPSTPRRRR